MKRSRRSGRGDQGRNDGGYVVRHYDITGTYDPASDVWSATTVSSARATQNLSRFDLDFDGMTIRRLEVNGSRAGFVRDGAELVATPKHRIRAGSEIRARATDSGVPKELLLPLGGTSLRAGFMATAGAVARRCWKNRPMPDAPLVLPGYAHVYSGKVRDLYAPVDPASGEPRPDRLLLVASDRISAYDFVLDTAIPDKGEVLTRLSLWWFAQLEDLVPNHVVTADVPDAVRGRAVLVERLEMLPVECVARAYLTGGGLGEYTSTGAVSGIRLPAGLVDGDRLPEPIFTPSTKAPMGEHDEPIPFAVVAGQLGEALAGRVRDLTVAILQRGNEIATERGILLADTKVEFGLRGDEVVLADEVLTPDSSRFWPADQWEPGHAQPSFDKQYVRDWLTSPASGWSKSSGEPPPPLPDDVVEQTRAKYVEAYERLTGESF